MTERLLAEWKIPQIRREVKVSFTVQNNRILKFHDYNIQIQDKIPIITHNKILKFKT